jgi:hypothetical protein
LFIQKEEQGSTPRWLLWCHSSHLHVQVLQRHQHLARIEPHVALLRAHDRRSRSDLEMSVTPVKTLRGVYARRDEEQTPTHTLTLTGPYTQGPSHGCLPPTSP